MRGDQVSYGNIDEHSIRVVNVGAGMSVSRLSQCSGIITRQAMRLVIIHRPRREGFQLSFFNAVAARALRRSS